MARIDIRGWQLTEFLGPGQPNPRAAGGPAKRARYIADDKSWAVVSQADAWLMCGSEGYRLLLSPAEQVQLPHVGP